MIIEQAVRDQLHSDTAIHTLVTDRIYYVKAPQDVTNPYIVLQKISGVRGHSHDGADGSVQARIQVSIFATTYKEAKDISEAVRAEIDDYKGTMQSVTVGHCFFDNETDLFEEGEGLYGIADDYLILYTE